MSRSRIVSVALLVALIDVTVRADEDPATEDPAVEDQPTEDQTTYEERRIEQLLAGESLTRCDDPEGKRIAFIRVVRDDVFVEDEFIPTFFNLFHWLTKEKIVQRELLIEEGQPYSESLVQETMRNLRELGIFTTVRIVAVETETPGHIGVIVQTRDLWTLRLEGDYQVVKSQVDYMLLQLTERNLFGLHKTAIARFILRPHTYQLGQVYADRRVFERRFSLLESADIVVNRASGEPEGYVLYSQMGLPFYNLSQKIAAIASISVANTVSRNVSNGEIIPYDVPETEEVEAIPQEWREQAISFSAAFYYRLGSKLKHTFALGFKDVFRRTRVTESTGLRDPSLTSALEAFERDVMPRELADHGPHFSYTLLSSRYKVYENLGTFGQSEDVRKGPEAVFSVFFPLKAFRSDANATVLRGGLGYIAGWGGWLVDTSVDGTSRFERGRVIDQRLTLEARGATPMMGFLRFVWRFTADARRRDTSNAQVGLGADNGLRGFVTQAFVVPGGSFLRANFELRTAPLVWQSIHVGGVLFYDVGTVYDRLGDAHVHYAGGIGLRFLWAQFNRFVFRFDNGFPLGGESGYVPSFAGSQAVLLTEAEDLAGP